MGKLKKVLLLVLALCVMISIMSIAAAAAESLPTAVDGVITLTEDVTLDKTWTLNSDTTLDLNGQTLTMNVTSGMTGAIYLNGHRLTVQDNSVGQTGAMDITSGAGANDGIGFNLSSGSSLLIEGGNITARNVSGNWTGKGIQAVTVSSDSSFTMTGGSLTASNANNSWKAPYAVNVSGGTASITGGTIIVDDHDTYGWSEGHFVYGSGTISVTGGKYKSPKTLDFNDLVSKLPSGYVLSATDADGYRAVSLAVAQIGTTKYASLADAIAAVPTDGTATTITMIADYEVPMDHADSSSGGYNVVNVAKDQNVILDLNGKTITGVIAYDAKNSAVITVSEYGTLTIRDTSAAQTGTITHVKYDDGVRVGNWAAQNWQTDILFNHGGTLTVEGGTIANTANGNICYAIDTSNNYRHNNATLTITGGTITSQYCDTIRMRLDQPMYGENSSRNVISISGGTISGRGGIWAQVSSGTAPKGSLTITGGTITGGDWGTLTYYAGSGVSIDDFPASITGGKITGTVELPQENYISGGKFSLEPEDARIAEGYEAVANTDDDAATYPFAVTEAIPAVAQIGNVKYATLAEALAAAQSGDTIKLLTDIETSNVVLIGKSITLDGDGHSLIASANRGIRIESGDVDVTIKNLTIPANSNLERAIQVDSDKDNVKLTIDNVTATATNYTVNICGDVDNLTLNIKKSTITGWGAINLWGNNGTVRIENSTLTGINDKTYNAAGWNNFGVLVIEGDTTGQTTEHAYAYNVTVVDTTIVSQSPTENKQFIIVYNNPSVENAITLENCRITLGGDKCLFFKDNGYSSVTKVKNTYLTGTTDRPELPEEYLYAPCGEDYYLITKAVAQIGDVKYETLQAAIDAAQDGNTITLLTNVTLTERLFINAGSTPAYAGSGRYATTTENKSITLDLNGKNITSSSNIALAGGSLTITGAGTIETTASGLAPVEIRGTGELTSKRTLTIGEDVVLTGAQYGLNVFGSNDGNKNVIDVTVDGTVNGTLFVLGNLINADNEIDIVVNGKVLAPANTDDAIVGIALNGKANVTVNTGAEIRGESGIEVRRGTLTVEGGTITATATEYSSTANNSGSTTKGAAIAIYQYGTGLDVTIKGGELSGVKTIAVNGDMSGVSASALQTYTTEKTVIPEGYKWAAAGENMYTLTEVTYVAQIGEVKYETLADAIAAAQDGDTIVLLTNVTQDAGILFDKANASVKLNLNAKTLTVNNGSNINNRAIRIDNGTLEVYNGSIVAVGSGTTSSNGTGCYGAFRVEANGKLIAYNLTLTNSRPWGLNVKVLGGEAELTNVTINSSYGGGIEVTEADLGTHSKAGKATLTNCTFTQENYFDHCSTALSVSGGSELIVNGGSYTGEYALYVFSSGGKIKVNGGTFTGLGNNNRGAIVAAIDTTTYPQYEGGLEISDGSFSGSYNITSPAYMTITGGYFTVDPTAYVADGYAVENGTYEIGDVTYNHKVVPYVEQSTTNTTTTTTTTDEQSGTTTTTTTTTNLATAENGDNTQYVIKVETTTVTTSTSNPENPTEDTNTVYKPVTVDVTSNNNVDNPQVTTTDVSASNADKIESAKTAIETDVTNAANAQSATFEAKLDENDDASPANVLKTTAAANAIAKAAATVSANQTENITDAKIELKTTLKSYTLADDSTNSSVKATKVLYDIKPVAVIYSGSEQLGNAVELDNADIKEGESFTFTIPVPANMTATTVKVSHIGTNGYSTEIGTYTVEGTGNNRYVTVTVDHFSEFELEEAAVSITGSCDISASISLVDSIDINFYVKNLKSGTNVSDYTVKYTFNGNETVVYGSDWTPVSSNSYKFTVASCAAKEINDTVTFEVLYNGETIKKIDSYSIRQYCVNKINANSNQKLVELCRAVLDYGAAAQNYFNYNKANLANADGYGLTSPVTEIPSEFNALAVDRRSDISKLTASLNTVSKTEINFYITASDVTDVTVKLGETTVEGVVTEQLSDGRYKVTIKGIAAAYLNNVYTLTFKTALGTSTLRYSALTYSYGKQSSQTAGELSLAIYNYYLKAAAYFG